MAATSREPPPARPTPPRTLLVVDDEASNRELILMLVDQFDLPIKCLTANNGLEAVRIAQEEQPALVLMDLKMPGLDGWEATRRLKADPATASIPILALTAQAMVGDHERAIAAGCDGYLTKPIDVNALVTVLR